MLHDPKESKVEIGGTRKQLVRREKPDVSFLRRYQNDPERRRNRDAGNVTGRKGRWVFWIARESRCAFEKSVVRFHRLEIIFGFEMEEIEYDIRQTSLLSTPSHKRRSRGSAEFKNKSNHGTLGKSSRPTLTVPNDGSSSLEDFDDRGWNQKATDLLVYWMRKSILTSNKHAQRVTYLKKVNMIVMLIYISLGPISSILSSLTVGNTFSNTMSSSTNWIAIPSIIVAVITMASSILAGVIAYLKLANSISKENAVVINFESLAREMEKVAALDIELRPEATTFLNDVSEKYTKYQQTVDVMEVANKDWGERLKQLTEINDKVTGDFVKNVQSYASYGIYKAAKTRQRENNYNTNSDQGNVRFTVRRDVAPHTRPISYSTDQAPDLKSIETGHRKVISSSDPKNMKRENDRNELQVPKSDYQDGNKIVGSRRNTEDGTGHNRYQERTLSERSIKEENNKLRSEYRAKQTKLSKSNSTPSSSFLVPSK